MYGKFTMETILATAFGRVLNIQRGEGDQLTEVASLVFAGAQEGQTTTTAFVTLILSELIERQVPTALGMP